MSRLVRLVLVILFAALAVSPLVAQLGHAAPSPFANDLLGEHVVAPSNSKAPSAEDTLIAFLQRSQQQRSALTEYSDITIIHADLPDTSQSGEYELRRRYVAPKTLEFKPIRFTGDSFVKSNIIVRLLQSEVDHVTKDDAALTAITTQNYKFKHKYTLTSYADNRVTYVYDVKPRKKRPGLFKGRIWIDAPTGALTRVEGKLVKSPSLFIKGVEFVQEYQQVDGFSLPSHLHSVSKVRILGRAVVDIVHRDYRSSNAHAILEVASGQ